MADDPAGPASHDGTRSYREILDDPFIDKSVRSSLIADSALGHTATVLVQRGDRETALLVLEVERVLLEPDEWNGLDLILEVSPEASALFTEEALDKLRTVCFEISGRLGYGINGLFVRQILPEIGPEWKEQLKQQLVNKRPTNHARKVRSLPATPVEDYLSFTNPGEVTLYRALKQIQGQGLPKDETIGIYPLPGVRLLGKTWEPDVLVTYKGHAGIIELDGPHHNGRAAFDKSRDHLYLDSGVAFVDRIPVEVLNDPTELTQHLMRFLRRMTGGK